MATFRLLQETKFRMSFKRIDNASKCSSTSGSFAEVLECKLDMDLKIETSGKLLKSVEEDSQHSNVDPKFLLDCKKGLANCSEGKSATISASMLLNYFSQLQASVFRKRKAVFQLSGDFLSNVVSEFEGLVTLKLMFRMRAVGRPQQVCWAESLAASPSYSEEGDCVFKFESSLGVTRWQPERSQFEGDVIILLVAESPIDKWTDGNVPLPSALNMNANILKKQIAFDFELVSEQGKRFKCHKVFLAVNSPVLARMLETECEEVKNKAYKMSLSDEGVKTFLDFIYRAESMESIPSPAVSLELLEAAHKYDVSALEEAMKALFLKQKSEWMEVDVAVMLYLHARKVKGYEPLMWKAVQVIKSKPGELMKSKLFDELFMKDPAAKEILLLALKTGSTSDVSARKKLKRSE